MIKRTIIYARVSTEDQVEKYGLPSQIRACREYAALNGLTVTDVVTDDGVSGVILERPGLERVRRMVREGLVDVVLMFDADRLSRELAHLLILKPEIEKRAALEFVAAKFEDSPSGRMFFGMRGVIAQYEREQTRERTMRGNRERARAGLVGGRIAYGYRCESGRLIPDESRAAIVRRIFTAYDSGLSTRAITRELREAGAPTWKGQAWGYSSVRRILTNETYAGVAYYGTHRREGKLLRLRERSERISMCVPALVDRELWIRVQGRMSSNPLRGRPSTFCLLRGLLYCKCGRRMYGAKKDAAYRCGGRDPLRVAPGASACYRKANLSKVDNAAWAALFAAFTDAAVLRAALQRQESALRAATPKRGAELRNAALRLKRKEDAAVSAMLDPDLSASRETIKVQYRAITGERRRVEAELAALEEAQRATLSTREWLAETAELLRDDLRSLTDQAGRIEFVRRMVHRAEWNGEEIRMECFICPQLSTTTRRSGQLDRLQLIVTARVAA